MSGDEWDCDACYFSTNGVCRAHQQPGDPSWIVGVLGLLAIVALAIWGPR